MTLLKELLNQQILKESPSLSDVDRYHKRVKQIREQMNMLEANFKEGSSFEKMIAAVGGDLSYFKDAGKAFNRFIEDFEQLEMYTDMSMHANSDDEEPK